VATPPSNQALVRACASTPTPPSHSCALPADDSDDSSSIKSAAWRVLVQAFKEWRAGYLTAPPTAPCPPTCGPAKKYRSWTLHPRPMLRATSLVRAAIRSTCPFQSWHQAWGSLVACAAHRMPLGQCHFHCHFSCTFWTEVGSQKRSPDASPAANTALQRTRQLMRRPRKASPLCVWQ
jgi:hypothetical protein